MAGTGAPLPLLYNARIYPGLVGLGLLVFLFCLPTSSGLIVGEASKHSFHALYIVNLVFFAGASGGTILVGTLIAALGLERLTPAVRIAEIAALSGMLLATIFLVLDLDRREDFWHLARSVRFDSLSIWNVAIIGIYLANVLTLRFFTSRWRLVRHMTPMLPGSRLYHLTAFGRTAFGNVTTAGSGHALWEFAVILVPAVVLVHAIPAWILHIMKTEPGWATVLIATLLYISTLVSSLALVVMASAVSHIFLNFPIADEVICTLGTVLGFLVPLLGYSLFEEMRMIVDAREAAGAHIFRELLLGPYVPLFWFVLIAGVGVPFFMLALAKTVTVRRVGVAALLVVLAVLVERWILVVPPLLGHAHVLYATGGYTPASPEIPMTLGAYAVGLLAYGVLVGWLRREKDVTSPLAGC